MAEWNHQSPEGLITLSIDGARSLARSHRSELRRSLIRQKEGTTQQPGRWRSNHCDR
jgi:hypothetical protein